MFPSYGGKQSAWSTIRGAIGLQEPQVKKNFDVQAKAVRAPLQTPDTDALTGLPNEVGFKTLLIGEIRRAQHQPRYDGEHLFVVYVDLNGVKIVNDSLGHDAGDVMLMGAGDAPRYGILREGEIFARLHGDEYAGLIHAPDYDTAVERGEELRDAMFEGVRYRINESSQLFGIPASHPTKKQMVLATARQRFSVAIGFAALATPIEHITPETLMTDALARADKQMYRQKQVHHLIAAEDSWREAVRNLHAFDAHRFETITDWLDDRESGLSLDTRTQLTIMLKQRDDLRWKVGIDAVESRENWLVSLVPGLRSPDFRTSPALHIDAAIVTELRARLGIRHSDQNLPEFSARPSAGQVERLEEAMDAMMRFDYNAAPHGVTGYERPSALVKRIPRAPGPLPRGPRTANTAPANS